MSAKYIYSLSDENPDLRKQVGCMHGFFQIFERRHFLGGARTVSQNQKRLPAPELPTINRVIDDFEKLSTSTTLSLYLSQYYLSSSIKIQYGRGFIYHVLASCQKGKNAEEPRCASHNTVEHPHKKASKEKQRNSTESSRTSFSSTSCSSSLSSLECSKPHQLEPSSFSQANIPKTSTPDLPMCQSNASLPSSQQSHHLQDIVKESIYRETRCLPLKTAGKEETRGPTLKYIDSPRPLQNPNTMNSKVSGLKESFRVLHKLREAPSPFSEGKNNSLHTRRFSFDGRESRETFKSTIKLKELPRLSLDSKAGSPRRFTSEMKSNYLLGDTGSKDGIPNTFLHQQEPGASKGPSTVVVKLMGLETFPDPESTNSSQTRQTKTHADAENNPMDSRTDQNKQNRSSGSSTPKNPHKEPMSPRLRNGDSARKPSKFPIEPAPWKQSDGSRSIQTPTPKSKESLTKAANSTVSVYGEIEKRLAQLEFKRSGKDLRALKQILEAMQKTKDILESTNETSQSITKTSSAINLDHKSMSPDLQDLESKSPIFVQAKGNNSPKSCRSPIVIMRPAKSIEKVKNPASLEKSTDSLSSPHKLRDGALADYRKESIEKQTAKDLTPRIKHHLPNQPNSAMNKTTGARSIRMVQISRESEFRTRECTNSNKRSETMNPRQQQKQLGMEKPSNPATQSLDSNRTKRQPSRQPAESRSPHHKARPKSTKLQPSYDESSEKSSITRELSYQGDVTSLHSESNYSLNSVVDEEVSSTGRSNKMDKTFIQQKHSKNQVARLTEDRSIEELATASCEQPSPVSVLDASFYSEELPSPIKKISIVFKDNEAPNSDEEWIRVDANQSPRSTIYSINSAMNNKKVEGIQSLIQNTQRSSLTHEEPKETVSFCNDRNAEHQYILEIVLASGLQNDFGFRSTNIHLHPRGHIINPDLFLALEQSRANSKHITADTSCISTCQSETHTKIRRQLLFDVVNEIVAYRLLPGNSSHRLACKRPKGLELWEDLCSEVDKLQDNNSICSLDNEDDGLKNIMWHDMMRDSMQWTACSDEIPAVVLDVERLIFKDLISEFLASEGFSGQGLSARHCRQSFSKVVT
ncbi:hypothetical protein Tsubulata_019420 [Turnera subulata]|uniref:DUF4378 domain-containing protein n=1 Tax=Turnera subulata TaxID=218843 RepID=A0A9Q0G4D1_9ROSI|nr:hypothetical protein Tsubulata_019420 [Turnera subulata]